MILLGGDCMIKKRDIAVSVILTILTCGIYGIVWFISLTEDVGEASNDHSISGGVAFLLSIVTCGIYSIYWSYMMGKKMYDAKVNRGMRASDNSVLYLILNIFGLGIVNYCLLQSELNEIADVNEAKNI